MVMGVVVLVRSGHGSNRRVRTTGTHAGAQLRLLLVLCTLVASTFLVAPAAQATVGDIGIQGQSYGTLTAPTGEKPESKLWFNDGRWWASMFDVSSGTWHIFSLDRSAPAEAWVDTGTVIDSRPNTLADALWDRGKLYIASHVKATSSTTETTGQAARLYRYSYDSVTQAYTLDSGFPTSINNISSETLTLDIDSTGTLWATWAQQQQVYVNASTANGQWGTPFALPVSHASGIDPDDISTLIAYAGGVGVMWSSQSNSVIYFSTHPNGSALSTWTPSVGVTVPGSGQADDHLNIKQIQSDPQGRVFAVIKTSLDHAGATAPQIVVLSRSASGGWSRATFGTVADCHTRPILMLDTTNSLVRVFATAPDSGCPFTGTAGTIFQKTSPMSALSFPAGRGTPVIKDAASPNLNNVTGSKQTVDASTGLVLLASNDVTKRYWFADLSLASTTVPVAAFSAAPTSGTAPLAVQFTDSSTGSPTSRAWDFGDGSTATTASPAHTYTAAGTYTVKLTATNAAGSNTVTKAGLITVSAASSGIGIGSSTTAFSGVAASAVSLAKPAGVAVGDVLVASITADLNPTMSAVPSGWVPMVNALSVDSSATTGARAFAYYHVVGSAEPASYGWSLSAGQKWGGGITAYHGVNTTAPLDTGVVTAVNSSFTGTSLALPSITTVSNGAMLISGVGLDSASPSLTSPPSGWVQEWGAGGGQIAAQADKMQPTAGATGTATWTLSAGRALGGWRVALKPAS